MLFFNIINYLIKVTNIIFYGASQLFFYLAQYDLLDVLNIDCEPIRALQKPFTDCI